MYCHAARISMNGIQKDDIFSSVALNALWAVSARMANVSIRQNDATPVTIHMLDIAETAIAAICAK